MLPTISPLGLMETESRDLPVTTDCGDCVFWSQNKLQYVKVERGHFPSGVLGGILLNINSCTCLS